MVIGDKKMVKVGDKVKVYRSGFFYAVGTVIAVKDGIVISKYFDNGEEFIVKGPEKWAEVL